MDLRLGGLQPRTLCNGLVGLAHFGASECNKIGVDFYFVASECNKIGMGLVAAAGTCNKIAKFVKKYYFFVKNTIFYKKILFFYIFLYFFAYPQMWPQLGLQGNRCGTQTVAPATRGNTSLPLQP